MRGANWASVFAFAAIYILWGSTYFAIRIAVTQVPPIFAAGTRFLIAGAALYFWSRARGVPNPPLRQWRNLWIMGALLILVSYSAVFWAETRVPSGVASVLVATVPVSTSLLEVFIFKKHRLQWTQLVALPLGLAGVAVLSWGQGGQGSLNVLACLAILAGSLSWSLGTVASKTMTLPASKPLSAGTQMMTGGLLLMFASFLAGELHPFPRVSPSAAWAILYLIVFGSIISFTAYTWLLGRMPASRVSSYAYVNPVVALALGHWFGGEPLAERTLLGAVLVLASVFLILRPTASTASA